MDESVASQLVPAPEIRENGGKRRPRLLLIQPLVGIGDMIWHKPWIDHLAAHYDVILATKPTVKPRLLFDGDYAIADFLMIERSMRGKRGKHDGLIGFSDGGGFSGGKSGSLPGVASQCPLHAGNTHGRDS